MAPTLIQCWSAKAVLLTRRCLAGGEKFSGHKDTTGCSIRMEQIPCTRLPKTEFFGETQHTSGREIQMVKIGMFITIIQRMYYITARLRLQTHWNTVGEILNLLRV